ncbi:disulfide bond formation protein B [Robbsia andropogonis]|uniref:disulfide bond formation protein B n=1 Tax=Robbsia andropogonis TaxID=28092 RepID=UPI0005604849|nr:disulfide bond formation protein B [Robbsia andropogonis]MCP1120070.1 disulfide bond formation protein B [Robbsia andropogonis]MCP1129871.1 disulfide bond formation protein B [Robbsia andropogonis]
MISNSFSVQASPVERRLLILLGVISLALVGGALYLQYFRGEDPCPLCILQRYAYLFMALFAFIAAAGRPRGAVRTLFMWLTLIAAVGGIAAAAKHVYVLSSLQSCGFDALQPIVDSLPPATWLPGVFKTQGLCETPYPPLLGLSLPAWALIGFALAFFGVAGTLRRQRARLR